MAGIQLTTLGRTELKQADGASILSVLSQPKRFALLVYLAVEGTDGFIRRDKVVALFWPEREHSEARANFRKSLHFLKKSLGEEVILTRGDEEVGVDGSQLTCDAVTLLAGGDASVEGVFLDGFHFSGAPVEWEEWLDGVRAQIRSRRSEEGEVDVSPVRHQKSERYERYRERVDGARAPNTILHLVARWRHVALGTAALAVIMAAGLGWALLRDSGASSPTRYDPIRLGSGAQHATVVQRHYALPPDGSGILFRDSVGGVLGTWWKPLDEMEASYVDGLDRAAGPVFSPDGGWVAFARAGELRKLPLTGEPSVVLATSVAEDFSPGLAWLPDGRILYEDARQNLMSVPDDGGAPELVTTLAKVGQVFHVRGLPGGGGALVVGCDGMCDASVPNLSYVDFERDRVTHLRSGVWMAWPMSDGHVVMVDGEGAVFAATFDPDRATLGQPIPLLDGIKVSPVPDVVMGRDGSLLYVPGEVDPYGERLVWVDRDGGSRPVDRNWPRNWSIRSLSLSPDDSRLALG